MMPKLSIITVNLNNSSGLLKTIKSVVSQKSQSFEYIIIDGGSTDGSEEIVKSYTNIPHGSHFPLLEPGLNVDFIISEGEDKALNNVLHTQDDNPSLHQLPPTVYCVSEPDHGIYHAMNKGIQLSRGKYLHFLNSGDWLVDNNVVKNMLNEITSLTSKDNQPEIGPDILVGNVVSVCPDGKVRYNRNTKGVSLFTFYRGTLPHTSAYIRKDLFDQYGLYDETLKIVADWKWYLIVAGLNKANVQFTDTYVTCFDTTGISSTQHEFNKSERRKVLEELIPSPVLADYDKYHFDILQIQRMKKYPLLYRFFWFVERSLFKFEKWNLEHFRWKNKMRLTYKSANKHVKRHRKPSSRMRTLS